MDRIGRFLAGLESRAAVCREEAERLTARAKASEKSITETKSMVLYFLRSRGLKRLERQQFTL